jgi:hypothetical protein
MMIQLKKDDARVGTIQSLVVGPQQLRKVGGALFS